MMIAISVTVFLLLRNLLIIVPILPIFHSSLIVNSWVCRRVHFQDGVQFVRYFERRTREIYYNLRRARRDFDSYLGGTFKNVIKRNFRSLVYSHHIGITSDEVFHKLFRVYAKIAVLSIVGVIDCFHHRSLRYLPNHVIVLFARRRHIRDEYDDRDHYEAEDYEPPAPNTLFHFLSSPFTACLLNVSIPAIYVVLFFYEFFYFILEMSINLIF